MATTITLTCLGVALGGTEVEVTLHGARRRITTTFDGRPPTAGESVLVSVDLEIAGAHLVERARR